MPAKVALFATAEEIPLATKDHGSVLSGGDREHPLLLDHCLVW